MNELSKKEAWTIVEGLIESYYSLEEMGESQLAEHHADLLDKLSPNWREADSCKEVEINKIGIDPEELV